MDMTSDFVAAQESISNALVATTRAATSIAAQDIGFLRTSEASIAASIDRKCTKLLHLTEKLLSRAASSTDSIHTYLSDADAIDSNWTQVVDAVDGLFERADTCLDEYTGLVKKPNLQDVGRIGSSKPLHPRPSNAFRNRILSKPQLSFEYQPSNHASEPFRPLLSSKPHSRISLSQSLKLEPNEEAVLQYAHPYQYEIEHHQYPAHVNQATDPTPPTAFKGTQATFVEDLAGVEEMLQKLKGAREIAIDLEHHDLHSYLGIVSLMQISTRDRDWIIDTLKPWRRKLEMLNQVFADPDVIKVMHGAHMDMLWLQRDLGLYVVGLFDTHHASRVLCYPGGSLAFLLKKFVDFDAQKQYQTADWRIRPLPTEMFEYARSDTHFLLYIYDCIRNELQARSSCDPHSVDCVGDVLERSKGYALQRYEYPFYDDTPGSRRNGWFPLLIKSPSDLSREQVAVFATVHKWRDSIARDEDESVNFIMPSHVLWSIARIMPETRAALLSLSNIFSPSLNQRLDELATLVRTAKVQGGILPGPESLHGNSARTREICNGVPSESRTLQSLEETQDSKPQMELSQFWGTTTTNTSASTKLSPFLGDDLHVLLPVRRRGQIGIPGSFDRKALDNITTKQSGDGRGTYDDAKENFGISGKASTGLGKRDIDQVESLGEPDAQLEWNAEQHRIGSAGTRENIIRHARRKAGKKARKSARTDRSNEDVTVPSELASKNLSPVDYGVESSLLNKDSSARKQPRQIKEFNPFSKAAEAPSGLTRSQNAKVGKTATFWV